MMCEKLERMVSSKAARGSRALGWREWLAAWVPVAAVVVAVLSAGGLGAQEAGRPGGRAGQPGAGAQGAGAQQALEDMKTCRSNLRNVHVAMDEYSQEHEGRMPPDLGSILGHFRPDARNQAVPDAEKARMFLCPFDLRGKAVPERPTAQWVNENTSYVYLGGADLKWSALPREKLGTTVIAHEKLTGSKEKHRAFLSLLMADGSVQVAPAGAAEKMIGESRKTLEASRGPR